jgi:hypothetical protein
MLRSQNECIAIVLNFVPCHRSEGSNEVANPLFDALLNQGTIYSRLQ